MQAYCALASSPLYLLTALSVSVSVSPQLRAARFPEQGSHAGQEHMHEHTRPSCYVPCVGALSMLGACRLPVTLIGVVVLSVEQRERQAPRFRPGISLPREKKKSAMASAKTKRPFFTGTHVFHEKTRRSPVRRNDDEGRAVP